jgi:outer membrane protein assembly factor BamE (lipoprotein component of BamABCDE complex)
MYNLRSATLLVSLLALSPISACSENGNNVVEARLMNVEVGMTRAQVLAIVGEPQRRETYAGTEFLIYPTRTPSSTKISFR